MNKNVRISISGLHSNDEETSDVVSNSTGTYLYKEGKHYVCFEELSQDGMDYSKSILKLHPDMIELIRRGVGGTHLYFEPGKLNNTYYNTVVGNIFIGVNTKYMDLQVSDKVITARIEYELVMNEDKVSDCVVEIEIVSL